MGWERETDKDLSSLRSHYSHLIIRRYVVRGKDDGVGIMA